MRVGDIAEAAVEAIVEQYTGPGRHERDVLLLISTRPALRDAFPGTLACARRSRRQLRQP